jgi:hypothetical protein
VKHADKRHIAFRASLTEQKIQAPLHHHAEGKALFRRFCTHCKHLISSNLTSAIISKNDLNVKKNCKKTLFFDLFPIFLMNFGICFPKIHEIVSPSSPFLPVFAVQ